MSKHTDDDEVNAALENLEKWKQFENMEFTKRVEKEKWKPRERTAEDEEIDNCTFENLDLLIKTKNLEIMTLPEFKREVYLAQKLNERHYRLMKENEQAYCTFFMKTGACRYGNACKRIHIIPLCSETILIDHMYKDAFNKVKNVTKGLEDSLLEIDEEEMQKNYEEFYDDVFAEWSKFGKIVQFKACNNLMSHLRGNVYIQYENVEASILAKVHLDGRFYGGYPLKVNFSLIKDWKQAICAYNGPEMSSCPKFSECNFLHVYRNPRNEFPLERRSPDRGGKPRRFDNNFRKKFSPPKDRRPVERYVRHERHERNERHERHERHRERSKERHEHRRHSRERDRDRKHHKRHSRSRSRSRDRKKKSHKKRSHSRERGRDKSRSRSKDNGDDKRKSKRHSKSKSKSRSPS